MILTLANELDCDPTPVKSWIYRKTAIRDVTDLVTGLN